MMIHRAFILIGIGLTVAFPWTSAERQLARSRPWKAYDMSCFRETESVFEKNQACQTKKGRSGLTLRGGGRLHQHRKSWCTSTRNALVAARKTRRTKQYTHSAAMETTVFLLRGGSDPTKILSFPKVFLLTILGSSVGFYSFLYFISVGYALGITLPLLASFLAYQKQRKILMLPANLDTATFWHTTLVILWGLRAFTFFLWREFVNWPALHKQIRFVHESNAPALPVKAVIWILYSFLYTALLSPCRFRLQSSLRTIVAGTAIPTSHGLLSRILQFFLTCIPLLLQATGLGLESVADYQKSQFKLHRRYEWCHVGLWKWSTHPNYLGEMLFWTGTYLGWIFYAMQSSVRAIHTRLSWWGQFVFTTMGYVFITTVLRGSIHSMGLKHWQKYGHLPEYATFRQTHGLVGLKLKTRQSILTSQNTNTTANLITTDHLDSSQETQNKATR